MISYTLTQPQMERGSVMMTSTREQKVIRASHTPQLGACIENTVTTVTISTEITTHVVILRCAVHGLEVFGGVHGPYTAGGTLAVCGHGPLGTGSEVGMAPSCVAEVNTLQVLSNALTHV